MRPLQLILLESDLARWNDPSFVGKYANVSHCETVAQMVKAVEPNCVVWGFSDDENPGTYFSGEGEEGHHFAVVNDRYIVDPWFFEEQGRSVFDLQSPKDRAIIRRLYGRRDRWTRIENNPRAGIIESYTENNSALLRYLRNGEFDPYRAWWAVCQWIVQNDMQEAIGFPPETSRDVIHDEEPELFYKLPEDDQRQCAEWCLDYLMQNDPAEAPTSAHVSVNKGQLIPASTWLVHFSDQAFNIALNGFTMGIDDMDRLGLTTWFNDSAKKHGGYNFAFEATSRDAQDAALMEKYGKHAVMFQNSGVHCTHYGDEEDQVIFWGKDVKPNRIIFLHRDYGPVWRVMNKYQPDGRPLFQTERYLDAANWVIKHHQQYRRALGL